MPTLEERLEIYYKMLKVYQDHPKGKIAGLCECLDYVNNSLSLYYLFELLECRPWWSHQFPVRGVYWFKPNKRYWRIRCLRKAIKKSEKLLYG